MACTSCGQPKSAESAVCPHCGARSPTDASARDLSADEVRALLAFERASAAPASQQSVFAQLLLPDVATTGTARNAEIVLTVLGLPAIFGALVMMLFGRRALAKLKAARGGEVAFGLLTGLFGGVIVWSVLPLLGTSSGTAIAVAAAAAIALVVRGFVRSSAHTSSDVFR